MLCLLFREDEGFVFGILLLGKGPRKGRESPQRFGVFGGPGRRVPVGLGGTFGLCVLITLSSWDVRGSKRSV